MATIGKLNVVLTAKTATFVRGMQAARTHVGKFAAKTRAATVALLRMAGALGVAVAGGAALFARSVKRQFAAIDTLAKSADALGLTTKELAAYELQAKLSGLTTDQLSTSIRRLEKNVSDATNGLATPRRAFEALGLDPKALKGLSVGQQLRAIADGLRKVDNQSDRARIALDLFGRSGLGMLNFLSGGAEALDEAARQAEQFGTAISRVDARRIELANDSITRLKESAIGLYRQVAVRLAPAVDFLAKSLTSTGKVSFKVTVAFAILREIGTSSVGAVLDMVTHLRVGFQSLKVDILDASRSLLPFLDGKVISNLAKAGIDFAGADVLRRLGFGGAAGAAEAEGLGLFGVGAGAAAGNRRLLDTLFKLQSDNARRKIHDLVTSPSGKQTVDQIIDNLVNGLKKLQNLSLPNLLGDGLGGSFADSLLGLEASRRQTEFIQGKRSRVAFGVPGEREQRVSAPALEEIGRQILQYLRVNPAGIPRAG